MSIKNKTILEECKLLDIVKKWSDFNNQEKCDEEFNKSNGIQSIVNNLVDKAFQMVNENAGDDSESDVSELRNELATKSAKLYETWNDLQQAFKIPKKQRNEERKEHERELNSSQTPQQHQQSPYSTSDTFNQNNKCNIHSFFLFVIFCK